MKHEDREQLPNAKEVSQAIEVYRATRSYNPRRVSARDGRVTAGV